MSFTAANVLAAPPVELPYVGIDEINEERAVKVIRALVQVSTIIRLLLVHTSPEEPEPATISLGKANDTSASATQTRSCGR
jgi:hypothetical protein